MEKIGKWQAYVMYSFFLFGGIFTIGGSNEAGRDSWLAFLIGGLIAIPINLLYIKIISNDESITKKSFGKKIGAVCGLIYVGFAVYSAVVTQSIFTIFVTEVSLSQTPKILIGALMTITVIYMLKKGVSTLARVCEMAFPFIVSLIVLSTVAAISQMDTRHMLPIAQKGIEAIANGTYTALFLPFLEGFFAIHVIINYSSQSPKKSIMISTLITTALICIVFIKNLGVVGWPMAAMMYFPSYTVASIIAMGSFFQRIEVFVSISFMVCKIIKITILLIFAADMLNSVFPRIKKETLKVSLAVLVFILSLVQFDGIVMAFESLQKHRYYLTVPLLVVPVIIGIVQNIRGWSCHR